jgi:hypothetical protein
MSTIFLLHGDKGYGESLCSYLTTSVFVEDDLAELQRCVNKHKVIVAYTTEPSIKSHFKSERLIEIYIGKREDLECITILTYISSERIQHSLNNFCLKCLQPKRVLLVSPGGSACTAFLQFLEKTGITINTANSFTLGGDGLKHCRPESYLVSAYDPTHVIYQYGNLDLTIHSLFRRGILDISYFYDTVQKYMNPLMRTTNKLIKFNSLQDYVNCVIETKEEPLGIVKHWKAWKSSTRNVYYIHYEDIHKCKIIDDFLGLPEGTCSEFTVKTRESKLSEIETEEYLSIIRDIDERCRNNSQINRRCN